MMCFYSYSAVQRIVKVSNDELDLVRAGYGIGDGWHSNPLNYVVAWEDIPECSISNSCTERSMVKGRGKILAAIEFAVVFSTVRNIVKLVRHDIQPSPLFKGSSPEETVQSF